MGVYRGPVPFTNNGTLTSVIVSDTSFSGNVSNAGVITTGLVVKSYSTVSGSMGAAIHITSSAFTGGSVNRGVIQSQKLDILADGAGDMKSLNQSTTYLQMITVDQIKAARKLLGWSQEHLAGHVGVSKATIGSIKKGGRRLSALDNTLMRRALEAAGVEFTNGGEPGVRMKAAGHQ
ncbi:MAG TPA: helix-turn-helix transcriptional regulator [Roseiarcus sp.]|nr:helix-turn-helix transcriptional regulator [Roseiarcus sp.]